MAVGLPMAKANMARLSRKVPWGSLRSIWTVLASTACTLRITSPKAATSVQYSKVTSPREGCSSSIQRSKFHFTASALKGVPSWKVTPSRRLKK